MPKREHRSNAEWQDIIARQEQSGLTGVAFCLVVGPGGLEPPTSGL